MVKAVAGEESRLLLVEERLSRSGVPAEVGLVVGKLSSSSDRASVFDLIPTPPNDAGESACSVVGGARDDKKKGSKGKSQPDSASLSIDQDWVAEHGRQVSRMLLGGMKVLGVYVWINESSFKNSTISLCQTVKGVAEAAPSLESDWDERLLIHISYSPRRWNCRNCILGSNISSSSLRPCEFRMGKVLSSLQTFKCSYNFDLRLPICCDGGSNFKNLAAILRHGILSHGKELNGAKAIVDGNLVVEEDLCTSDGSHEVQFLLPFMKDSFVEACSQKEVVGILGFSGSVHSIAYANPKEPLSQAMADLKGDIIKSLLSRLDIVTDEADGEFGAAEAGQEGSDEFNKERFLHLDLQSLRKQVGISFPRRVFIPWLGDAYISDYLQPSEALEVIKEHCVELMSMEAPTDTSTILEPEVEALALSAKSFSDVAVPFCSASISDSSSSKVSASTASKGGKGGVVKSTKFADLNFIVAVCVLILAILVGFAVYVVKAS